MCKFSSHGEELAAWKCLKYMAPRQKYVIFLRGCSLVAVSDVFFFQTSWLIGHFFAVPCTISWLVKGAKCSARCWIGSRNGGEKKIMAESTCNRFPLRILRPNIWSLPAPIWRILINLECQHRMNKPEPDYYSNWEVYMSPNSDQLWRVTIVLGVSVHWVPKWLSSTKYFLFRMFLYQGKRRSGIKHGSSTARTGRWSIT